MRVVVFLLVVVLVGWLTFLLQTGMAQTLKEPGEGCCCCCCCCVGWLTFLLQTGVAQTLKEPGEGCCCCCCCVGWLVDIPASDRDGTDTEMTW